MEGADWDLQAVVRGCRGGGRGGGDSRDPFLSSPPPLLLQDGDGGGVVDGDVMFCFPNLMGTEAASAQELEQLYKPFVHRRSSQALHQQKVVVPLSASQTTITSSSSSSAVALLNRTGGFVGGGAVRQPQQQHQQRSLATTTTTSRSKRRKNQQKRVVCHVPADGLSSDMWAWRKYGQKPIKGSPYPRGYYRCSSSKGCLARKQVERSRTDPGVFIITYTAEHNHPVPAHRNSLAGSTRHRFPQTTTATATTTATTTLEVNYSAAGETRMSSSTLSPTTPLVSTMEEDPLPTPKKEGREEDAEEEEDDDDNEEGMLLVSDMEMLGEDDVLFLGVDDLPRPFSDDHLQAPFSAPQWVASGGTTMSTTGGV